MFVVRPALSKDIDALLDLAQVMAPGITTFPPDKKVLAEKIEASISSFNQESYAGPRDFLMVLEDTGNGRIAGTAGVYSQIGHEKPFYSFKVVAEDHKHPQLDIGVTSHTLHLTNDLKGGTEVGTLLLHPDYAGKGLGKLLAKSRYLLIKTFNSLFSEPVFAELRGVSNEQGESPFWNAIGKHFFGSMPFIEADLLSATTNNAFITDLMPKHPIYLELLPKAAQDVINKANTKGQAALNMLYKEGFKDQGYIDIFDAGATVVASFSDIDTITNSKHYNVLPGRDNFPEQDKIIVCNHRLSNFRVTQLTEYTISDSLITMTTSAFNQLHLDTNTITIY